ncbi:murein biosynthesis integral membrane protein MurJ [Candidatus Dependentiae bacterium]|nr:murein biosynthesis integral membrane protein MurJ [Candidatus Dependentiae bacterium]
MNSQLDKRSILKKTAQFGGATLISRFLGIARELLRARFLGVGAVADAFIMAFKIPHFLRRIFAEGALAAAFVPVFVRKVKKGEFRDANGLMSLSFLFFEGIVFCLCLFVCIFPHLILKIIAPGFSSEQIQYAVPFLRILFPIIFFISSSALFAGALNSVNHFFIPAFGPVVMNIFFVGSLLFCLKFNLSVLFLCVGILLGGFFNFLMHFVAYLKYNFTFGVINYKAKQAFKTILKRFLPTLFGVSIVEINLFIDCIIASFLPVGSVSLIEYSGRFMNIPIGVFAVGFATVLLPQFSRLVTYAPKRLNFYILEVTKFVSFLIIPTMLFLIFISEPIFSMVMLKGKASVDQIFIAKWLLIIYSLGLVFFCLNKILVNIFYSVHDTITPTIALSISSMINFVCNVIGMKIWGIFGIVASTSLSGITLTFLLLLFLKNKYGFRFYSANFFNFLGRYLIQIFLATILFLISYFTIFDYLGKTIYFSLFFHSWGYWLIVLPLFVFMGLLIFLTRKFFGIKLYFLSK